MCSNDSFRFGKRTSGDHVTGKDLPHAEVQFLETGHFAIETHVVDIAAAMKEFLGRACGSAKTVD